MNVFNEQIIVNATMNTTILSPAVPLVNLFGYTVQAVYAGNPNGSIKLQGSVDAFKYATPNQPEVPMNWNDIDRSNFVITSAGIYTWNVTNAFYTFVRVVYTDASGGTSTGVLNVTINPKGP
jgi:hypothetical protein